MSNTKTQTQLFSNQTYDILKFVALIFLPALSVFYLTVAPLWGLPKQEEVSATIMAVDLLLGACLRLSTKTYNASGASYDGYLDANGFDEDTGMPNLKMVITKLPDEILSGDVARLKVGPPPRP